MHEAISAAFDETCRHQQAAGRVLEIGAVPSAHTLLALPSLAAASEKIGINPEGPSCGPDFVILGGDANSMGSFTDASFDVILCNSVLEHDRRFWPTHGEIRRVGRPGALVAIGAPGYAEMRMPMRRIGKWLGILPFADPSIRLQASALQVRTPTLAPPRILGWGGMPRAAAAPA